MSARSIIALLASLVAFAAAAGDLATRKTVEGGVTVIATPGNLAPGASVWDFAVVMDTHSQDLADDLASSAVLVGVGGGEAKAISWEGAAPGGHHRAGVLTFRAIAPRPQAVELRINRPGESRPRVFRWDLE